MNLDYFYEKRRHILIKRSESVPDYTALVLPDENLGKVDNQGIEFKINYENNIGNVNYNVGGQFTYNHNEIVYMDEAKDVPNYRKKEGHPIDSWVVYKTDGIFNTQEEIENADAILSGTKPGDIKYVDIDGDGEITSDDMIRKYTSPIPEIQFGLNAGIQYKGFGFRAFLQGQTNAEVMIQSFAWGNFYEYYFTKRWTENNKDAELPRASDRDDYYNGRASDYWLYDASFLKLREAELSYNLPSKWMPDVIEKIRVYMRGSNLFSIDKMPNNIDPEVINVQAQYYPQIRTISGGFNITF
jgi:TonB-dependent starch-binding outer membrane protein SusC